MRDGQLHKLRVETEGMLIVARWIELLGLNVLGRISLFALMNKVTF